MIIYTKSSGTKESPLPSKVDGVIPVKARDNSIDKRFFSKDERSLTERFSQETGTSLLQEVSLGRQTIRSVSASAKSVYVFSETADNPETRND